MTARLLCFLDFEATCDDPVQIRPQEIIEFPVVLYRWDGGCGVEKVDELRHYIKPLVHPRLTAFCQELTGIKQADVDGGVSYEEAEGSVLDLLRSHLGEEPCPENCLIITCGDWDLGTMLPQQYGSKNCHKIPPVFRSWCNMKVPFELYTGLKGRGMAGMLSTLKMDLLGRHHCGLDDTRNIARIGEKFIQHGCPLFHTKRVSFPRVAAGRNGKPHAQGTILQIPDYARIMQGTFASSSSSSSSASGAGARKRMPRPNHFVALPLSNPDLVAALEAIQTSLVERFPSLEDHKICPEHFHFTLALVHLNKPSVDRAQCEEALRTFQPRLQELYQEASCRSVDVRGLGEFQRGRVIWAGTEGPGLQLLRAVQSDLVQHLAAAGISVQGADEGEGDGATAAASAAEGASSSSSSSSSNRSWIPHLTLFKTRRIPAARHQRGRGRGGGRGRGRGRGGRGRGEGPCPEREQDHSASSEETGSARKQHLPIKLEELLEALQSHASEVGAVPISLLHLHAMGAPQGCPYVSLGAIEAAPQQ